MKLKLHKDKTQRVLHSSDISLYEILPSGVVFPQTAEEVEDVLRTVKALNASSKDKTTIHSRGAGTAAAGQSLGKGIVVNFTRSMNRIIEVDKINVDGDPLNDIHYVDTEPGVILGKLNKHLAKYGLFMPVDPSSIDVCSLGGMVANNSSGIHSYLYGDTKDYVLELEGYWADGRFFSTYTGENTHHLEKKLRDLAPKAEKLQDKLPRTAKNSSGYNIRDAFRLYSTSSVPARSDTSLKHTLLQLLIGSEGTLAVITKIRFRVIKLPQKRVTVLSLFDDIEKSLQAVKLTSSIKGISAIELLDQELIETSKLHYPDMKHFFYTNAGAGLIFEIDGDSDFVDQQHKELLKILSGVANKIEDAVEPEKRERLWWIRKSASSILNRIEGSIRSLRFIEDVGVPVDSIMDFYEQEKKILEKYGLRTAFFGHIGSGHFHINPRIDTRKPDFWDTVEKVSEETYELVSKLGGTLDAEHGDGILREPYIRKFQPELYELYVEIKDIFDPEWILNPGKIVNRRRHGDKKASTENIRYLFTPLKDIDASILNEVEKCHGCGDCVNFCESYKSKGYRHEGYNSRGRANIMRAIVSGIITDDELDHALKYIDACMLCGNCLEKCPTGIDIIKTASILRERGILPMREKEKLLMILFSPYKKYLIWKLSRAENGSKVKVNAYPALFRLGLYYIPYLEDLAEVIKTKNLYIETDIEPLKMYLKRYGL
jgi:FAD/FMN-containing dehydrogenase/ferredoxin